MNTSSRPTLKMQCSFTCTSLPAILYYWFQLSMSTFSTRTLVLGHHETVSQISQPIFELFLKFNSLVHNLLVWILYWDKKINIYGCGAKCVPILCLMFFCVCSKTPFSIFTSQNSSQKLGESINSLLINQVRNEQKPDIYRNI